MGKVKGKHRLDKYYHLAKEHGYRSRAAWKLVQMDSKFSFLRSSRGILDLCAAPGGWMQVAVERAPVASLVVGIDLVPIRPIRGAVAIEEDITKTECKSKIKRVMNEHGCRAFDLVLHDGSPNVGGAWVQGGYKPERFGYRFGEASYGVPSTKRNISHQGPKITVQFSTV